MCGIAGIYEYGRGQGGVSEQLVADMRDTLHQHVYDAPALVPASPWLATAPAMRPQATATLDSAFNATAVQLNAAVQPSTWIVRARSGSHWQTVLLPGSSRA